jgi:hypothetical protein
MLHSFVTVGVKLEDVHIVCAIHGEIDPYFDKLMQKYPGVLFSFYEDTRDYKGYIPSIKQHLLHKHYLSFPVLENETVFLTDCDICLVSKVDFEGLLDDNIWYLSDTISYIGYDYIKLKGDDILKPMLDIAGISEDIVKSMQNASGGAQYLLKNVKASFWSDVVEMSHNLYRSISNISKIKKQKYPEYHEIQIWTAEMWAMLWVAWKRGQMTSVSENLSFSWATDPVEKWSKNSIFHNAGVTNEMKDLFYKGAHINSLPGKNIIVSRDRCSYMYYNILKEALV